MIRKFTKILFLLLGFLSICFLSSCGLSKINNHELSTQYSSDITPIPTSNQSIAETTLSLSPVEDIDCTRFVAFNGNDGDLGTESEPWGSFQYAAELASPGDVICFREGIYKTHDIHVRKSGGPNNLITFAAYPGELPILDGGGTASELLVLDGGVSNVRISGFGIRNFRIWGIFLSGENHNIHLDHLIIEGGEAGIRFTYGESSEGLALGGLVENIVFEDSIISGSQYSAVDCTPGPCNYVNLRHLEVFNTGLTGVSFYGSDGIEFARGHHIVVEDCYVHDNGGDGIDLGSRDREGHIEGIIVRRNRVERNHLNGIKVWAGGRIENNLLWGQGNSAIWSGTFDSTIEIIHNTVAYNMWDGRFSERNWAIVVGYPEELPKPEVDLMMFNNVFAFNADPLEGGPTGVYLGSGVKIKEGHNLYFSNPEEEITVEVAEGIGFSRQDIQEGNWSDYANQGEGDLVQDPLFISGWPDVDLSLKSNSPAINAGASDQATKVDVLSILRDDMPDLGAIEY